MLQAGAAVATMPTAEDPTHGAQYFYSGNDPGKLKPMIDSGKLVPTYRTNNFTFLRDMDLLYPRPFLQNPMK